MIKRHKDLLRSLIAELRRTLAGGAVANDTWQRGDLDRELERLGIAPDGTIRPLDALPDATIAERRARRIADAQLEPLAQDQRVAARGELVERAAYSWINRLLALRAMESRGLIDETLRANPDYGGVSEALFVLRDTQPECAAGADAGWWAVLDDACAVQAAALPGLFDPAEPSVAMRPSTPALLRCIALVGGTLPGFTLDESDAAFRDPDAVGWAYQFYQDEAKKAVYAKLGSGGKAGTRAEIAAATQLFTEPYMVKWLLQNSLGRSYHERHPDSTLPKTWEYYIRPEQLGDPSIVSLSTLTVMDPCMGSGHFLREAFDMLAAMYREQQPELSATEIADRVLSRHLHGIDIDPRAAQLTALTLYLRAWELVRDERKARRQPGPGSYRPAELHLATTPTNLNAGALQRHLRRHPEDRILTPLLEGIFASLEQADILGSLLRPREHFDEAIQALRKPHTMQLDFDADDAALRRTITELARHDPEELKQVLLERVADSFAAEAGDDDVVAALFGREAERGVRLLQLLDRSYAVVVTNPPYMGSKNMDVSLKTYVEKYYRVAKADLYASFILRCRELCIHGGRIAMITQQSWMFLRTYVDLRGGASIEKGNVGNKGRFRGLLRETSIEALAHLGRYAFSEIGNAVVAPVMFSLQARLPTELNHIWACRLSAPRPSEEQAALLLRSVQQGRDSGFLFTPRQTTLLGLPETPLVYWLAPEILHLISSSNKAKQYADFLMGLSTADNTRYTRCYWEIVSRDRWKPFTKGGGYTKWCGLEWLVVDWEHSGTRIKSYPLSAVRNEASYFVGGLTYSMAASGSVGIRRLRTGSIFEAKSPGIITKQNTPDLAHLIMLAISGRVANYVLRAINPSIDASQGYTSITPLPFLTQHQQRTMEQCGGFLVESKQILIATKPTEWDFHYSVALDQQIFDYVCVLLATTEGFLEGFLFNRYDISGDSVVTILAATGIPAGLYALIRDYDTVPVLYSGMGLPALPSEVVEYLGTHERISLPTTEHTRIKANLRALYEAGPGAKDVEQDEGKASEDEDEEGVVGGAYIPIPTETFLEELSVKVQIHPISVYWLLDELRAEGVRCKPEERRLLEDRLSVLVLRLLGHRWPKQLEAGEPVPEWADADGIIPLMSGAGEATLADRLRARLRAEDGDTGAQQTEALLAELTGQSLDEWLRRRFFERHVRQFKYRPIAWHLATTPGGGKKKSSKRPPAFECMLYYHACNRDVLARIRTQYVEPLLLAERRRVDDARREDNDTAAAIAAERIHELEDFGARLRQVEDSGFASAELDKLLANEPLDRWSGDGYLAPTGRDELLHDERAWRVDLNDGVRVNIAPIQQAGLLASDVLKSADFKKSIVDRARWRSDERRWVREGKLPRPGWMDESVPESNRWTELAPQRAAEQAKLAQKRQAALEQIGDA